MLGILLTWFEESQVYRTLLDPGATLDVIMVTRFFNQLQAVRTMFRTISTR